MHGAVSKIWLLSLLTLLSAASVVRAERDPELPRYDLRIVLDTAQRTAQVSEIVTWTNRSSAATREIVFNAHAHYEIPDSDIGFLAKSVEILRMAPKEALNFDGPALQVLRVAQIGEPSRVSDRVAPPDPLRGSARPVAHHFAKDNSTALIVPLAHEVKPGETVTLELDFTLKLPAKRGRWGQWDGITTMAQWLPVVAVFDELKGWQPTPFIPWHQPFFNEAGHYTVQVRLPSAQKLAASASVREERDLGDGWKEVVFQPICVRDFALIACARFEEFTGDVDGVHVRVLALPEHAFYAKVFVDTVREAIPVYNQWFGKYPYPQFTVVESCFGWNGNECGALVMIDDRMFNMPHIAKNYPAYLLQHELCHQWWYNTVGTNGYAETWMDEGLATYFSHRLANQTFGKNNALIEYPNGLGWLPNIRRDDFRNYSMVGAWARGAGHATVVDKMPDFDHLVNLTAAAYDRGGKVVGMIEERLGEPAFFDFMRHIYSKYQFRILRVADFQQELEVFTGRPWDDFFRHWVYSPGRCDWAVERVEVEAAKFSVFRHKREWCKDPVRVVVHLKQQGEFNEPTTLGIRLQDGSEYQVRVPIHPDVPALYLEEMKAVIQCSCETKNNKQYARARVEIELPFEPLQISVDPDSMLVDAEPTNNHWKRNIRWHLTPLYTALDEMDVSNAYDRWNVNLGPWLYMSSYTDPWYVKSRLAGFRAGVYRTQELDAGTFLAYRTSDRNVVAGVDVLWDHVPIPQMQLGLQFEHSLAALGTGQPLNDRGVIFSRYIMMYGSSLYLPPFEYVEAFALAQRSGLPYMRDQRPNTDPFNSRTSLGTHYHKNLMTPYWDAEGGFSFDLTYQYGLPIFGAQHDFHQTYGQFAIVKGMPKVLGPLEDCALGQWLYDTRFAFRVGGAAGLPNQGLLFPLGGGDYFRGFDLAERQGNMIWYSSLEWRVPLATRLNWDLCDHLVGVRNVYLAPFYDVGNAYVQGHPLGNIAHAVGAGVRVDVTWLGLIERTMLRFDVAKAVNTSAPAQFWFGIQHPF